MICIQRSALKTRETFQLLQGFENFTLRHLVSIQHSPLIFVTKRMATMNAVSEESSTQLRQQINSASK